LVGIRYTIEEISKKSIELYGNMFYIDLNQIYINMNTNINITCNICGETFSRYSSHHLRKNKISKCPFCQSHGFRNLEFVRKKSKEINGDKFSIPDQIFKNMHTVINIHCNICDTDFPQESRNHINKKEGCPECLRRSMMMSLEDVQIKSNKIHGEGRYIIDTKQYHKNRESEIEIFCTICKEFFNQKISVHLNGCGCTTCRESHGEKEILKILKNNDIKYIKQYKFFDCKNIRSLPFDFYLPNYNICIEFDGIQHFESREFLGGEESFKKTKINDKIKNNFCQLNQIKLIRIKYNENIQEKLKILF